MIQTCIYTCHHGSSKNLNIPKRVRRVSGNEMVKRESDLREDFFVLSLTFPIVVVFALVVVSNIRGLMG